ncbi:mucin-binding protein [Melissococcus plutonius]|uniref:mucin-binding protein n=1 Tax=Melissococcus plutonius TaxID=33970 RepID=UPI003EE4CC2A
MLDKKREQGRKIITNATKNVKRSTHVLMCGLVLAGVAGPAITAFAVSNGTDIKTSEATQNSSTNTKTTQNSTTTTSAASSSNTPATSVAQNDNAKATQGSTAATRADSAASTKQNSTIASSPVPSKQSEAQQATTDVQTQTSTVTIQYVDTTTGQVFASKPIEGKVGEAVTYSIPQESKKLTLDVKRLPKGTEQNGDNFVWNGVCTAEKQTITFYYGEVKEGTITFNLVDNATGKIIRTTEKTPKIGEDVSYAAPDSFKHFKINAKRLPIGAAQEGENFIWRGVGKLDDQTVNFYYDEAEQGTITFNLVDNITGKIIRSIEKTPKIGEDISYTIPEAFKNFKLNTRRLPEGTTQEGNKYVWTGIGKLDDQIVNFYYDETIPGVTNTETKDITRTIDLVKDGKVFKEEIQTVHFTRTATTDQMTGKTTYTDWETTHAKFDDFKLSDIEGYTHKNKMIKAMPVKVTDKDVVVTELYTKVTDGKENNGNNNQGTTNNGGNNQGTTNDGKSNKGINTNKNNNQKHANLGYHKAGDPKKNHFANKGNTATKKLPMTGEKISKIVASSGFGVLMLTAAAWVISKRKRTN